MTPNQLLDALEELPVDAPLVFHTEAGPIGGGYHVTEWRRAQVDSIDCGVRTSSWADAVLQLLDGRGDKHMTINRFTTILRQSLRKVDGLGESRIQVEFAHGNQGLRLYSMFAPQLDGDAVILRLAELNALCKPALLMAEGQRAAAGCCSAA